MDVYNIARVCYEVNKSYCESIGDFSHPSWSEASTHIRNSIMQGVEFHMKSDSTPEESHENWMKFKVADGWVYGEVKDEKKKTHPCIVPYDQLPQKDKSKDYIFRAVVESLKGIQC